jgi:mRNA deadenylase 3'-5' endonuclease subunit Ccr4
MSFKAATWNVLATSYLGNGDYSLVPPRLLDPEWRVPAVARRAARLNCDLLCLQEVEPDVFAALLEGLTPLGFAGVYESKGRKKPDGCSTFYRTDRFVVRAHKRLEYHDRERGVEGNSGFVALMLAVEHGGRLLGVANTHLRWDRPGTSANRQIGHRQVEELVEECRRFVPTCADWLVCGDFNRKPDSEVPALLRESGFDFAHRGRRHVCSAVIDGRGSLIDFLFHTGGLTAWPSDPPLVAGGTVLPAEEEPSDHLPLAAKFEWVSSGQSGTAKTSAEPQPGVS